MRQRECLVSSFFDSAKVYNRECEDPKLPEEEDKCKDAPSITTTTYTDTGGDGGTEYQKGDMVMITIEEGDIQNMPKIIVGNFPSYTENGETHKKLITFLRNEGGLYSGTIPEDCTLETCKSFSVTLEDGCDSKTEEFEYVCDSFLDLIVPLKKTYKPGDVIRDIFIEGESETTEWNIETEIVESKVPEGSIREDYEAILTVDLEKRTSEITIPIKCTHEICPSFTIKVNDDCKNKEQKFTAVDPCNDSEAGEELTITPVNPDGSKKTNYTRGETFKVLIDGGVASYKEKNTKAIFASQTATYFFDERNRILNIENDSDGKSYFEVYIPTECTTKEKCAVVKLGIKDSCDKEVDVSIGFECTEGDTRVRYSPYQMCHTLCEAQTQVCKNQEWEVRDNNEPGYPNLYSDEECEKCKEGDTRICFRPPSAYGQEKSCCDNAKDNVRWACDANGKWQTTSLNTGEYKICTTEDNTRPSKEQEELIKNAPPLFVDQKEMYDYFMKNGSLMRDSSWNYFCKKDFCMQNVRYFMASPSADVEKDEKDYRKYTQQKLGLQSNHDVAVQLLLGSKPGSPKYQQFIKYQQFSGPSDYYRNYYVDKNLPYTKAFLAEIAKFKGTEVQILAQIYNFIGDIYTYDFCHLEEGEGRGARKKGLEEALENKSFICVDYAIAVCLASEVHGINCTKQNGYGHIWNRHVIDGKSYPFVINGDATWYQTFTPLPPRISDTFF